MQFEDWFFTHTNNGIESMDDMHKAFLAGKASAIPDGYVLVPVEPTLDMICDIDSNGGFDHHSFTLRLYKAMIAAAQKEMK